MQIPLRQVWGGRGPDVANLARAGVAKATTVRPHLGGRFSAPSWSLHLGSQRPVCCLSPRLRGLPDMLRESGSCLWPHGSCHLMASPGKVTAERAGTLLTAHAPAPVTPPAGSFGHVLFPFGSSLYSTRATSSPGSHASGGKWPQGGEGCRPLASCLGQSLFYFWFYGRHLSLAFGLSISPVPGVRVLCGY